MYQINRKDSVEVMPEGYLSQHRREYSPKVGKELNVADHCTLVLLGKQIDFQPHKVISDPA